MVFRIVARSEEDVVLGRSGNSVLRRLDKMFSVSKDENTDFLTQ